MCVPLFYAHMLMYLDDCFYILLVYCTPCIIATHVIANIQKLTNDCFTIFFASVCVCVASMYTIVADGLHLAFFVLMAQFAHLYNCVSVSIINY